MDYFKNKRVSQSDLTLLGIHPRVLKNELDNRLLGKTSTPSDSMILGSLVDCLITEPENYNDQFIVDFNDKPTSGKYDLLEHVYSTPKTLSEEDVCLMSDNEMIEYLRPYILNSRNKIAYDKRMLDDTVIEMFFNRCLNYYRFKSRVGNRLVISNDMYEQAIRIIDSLKSNEVINEILEDFTESQKVVEWEMNGVELKSKLDFVKEHQNAYYITDLKTTYDYTSNFINSVYKYRYDIQAAFYVDAIKYLMEKGEIPNKPVYFRFVVESTTTPGSPLIYECSEDFLRKGRYGFTLSSGEKYKGYQRLLNDYQWHINEGKWDYPRELYLNNFTIEL